MGHSGLLLLFSRRSCSVAMVGRCPGLKTMMIGYPTTALAPSLVYGYPPAAAVSCAKKTNAGAETWCWGTYGLLYFSWLEATITKHLVSRCGGVGRPTVVAALNENMWILVFTARRYASAVSAVVVCSSVSLSVSPSVTTPCCIRTAKRRIMQATPHDSAGTLVF